jgi:hypothetical protein
MKLAVDVLDVKNGGSHAILDSVVVGAGAMQLAMIAANFALPKRLRCKENLVKVSPMIRALFIVHWLYIVLVLGIFAALCFWFAPELAGASRLGRFLSLSMAFFWILRIPIQFFFYDPEIRRQHRLADVTFLVTFLFLGIVFGAGALGAFR